MPIWNQLRQAAQGMQTQLVAKKNDLKSGAFRDASMAMCALVAAADGSIDVDERRKVSRPDHHERGPVQLRGRRSAGEVR